MNNPEKIAAILAIRLLEARKQYSAIENFCASWFNRRDRVEKLAETFLKEDDLPIKPYIPHIVHTVADHFANPPLPTEQEIIDWIAASGGISALLLRQMALGVGPSP
jgi:hypothetical protein